MSRLPLNDLYARDEVLRVNTDGVVLTGALSFGEYGVKTVVIDEVVVLTNAVETNLSVTVPAKSVIRYVQANLDTLIVGDASGDNLGAKVGIGVTADPDKYGITADLVKNTKINNVPTAALLAAAETVTVKFAKTDGSAATEKFVAGGRVRVRITYDTLVALPDAA